MLMSGSTAVRPSGAPAAPGVRGADGPPRWEAVRAVMRLELLILLGLAVLLLVLSVVGLGVSWVICRRIYLRQDH